MTRRRAHRDVEARKTTGSVVLVPYGPVYLSLAARSGTIRPCRNPHARNSGPMLAPGAAVILPGVANALAARVRGRLRLHRRLYHRRGHRQHLPGHSRQRPGHHDSELADHVTAIREVFPGR